MRSSRAAAVVGSGPNGLAAAVTLARAGIPVTVFEAMDTIGGGARTPVRGDTGLRYDVCSSVHPMAIATGFFASFELTRRVSFTTPEVSFAHPLGEESGFRAAVAYRDIDRTAIELGRDGAAYRRLFAPLLARLDGALDVALGGALVRWPKDLRAALALAARTVEQGSPAWGMRFREQSAPALFAGIAAHNIGPMPSLATAGVALLLGSLGHSNGWPVPIGGSQAITDALVADLIAHGGTVVPGSPITSLRELDGYTVKLFDTSARGLANIGSGELPSGYERKLRRLRYGNAAAKVDLVLSDRIPWRDARVHEAPTVHLGGTRREIAAAEAAVARGVHAERPYVLLVQPTQFDPSRNPPGVHVVSAYAHVPSGSTTDPAATVLAQIERFAPGVRDLVIDVRGTNAEQLGRDNQNYIGGDFSAGAVTLSQLVARPVLSPDPWRTPLPGVYLCSSSTAPGPGVHGLSGWYAARSALRHEYGLPAPELGLSAP